MDSTEFDDLCKSIQEMNLIAAGTIEPSRVYVNENGSITRVYGQEAAPFPTTPPKGYEFYRDDLQAWFQFDGSSWTLTQHDQSHKTHGELPER